MKFVLVALAMWRIVSLFVNETGPLDIFSRFRYFIGVRHDESSVIYGKNTIAVLFTCVWCLSLWVCWLFAFLTEFTTAWEYLVNALALSAVVIVVDEVISEVTRR